MPLVQQNNIFIDPENCGSSVGYYLGISEYTDKKAGKTTHSIFANVVLTDCTRRIDWSFNDNDGLSKIDAAIKLLQEFRKKYADTEKMVKQLNK